MFLNIGFSHEWWHRNYGFVFDESFYMDIANKAKIMRAMDEIMAERFPYYTQNRGLKDSVISNPTIAVEPYGHRFIPALFGCEISYSKMITPWPRHTDLSDEEIMSMPFLTPGEFGDDEKVQVILRQAGEMRALGLACSTQQNTGSVINTAIYLRKNLFTDFYDKPEIIHRLFALISNRIECSVKFFSEADGRAGDLGVGNCAVCMLSPKIYETFNRPCDLRIMELARSMGVRFSMHQDSDVTPYIESYKSFDYLYSFDVGQDTDIQAFRRVFPDVVINIFIYSAWLLGNDAEAIRRGVTELAAKAGPPELAGISCYDIDPGTEDEKIEALCTVC